MAKHFEILSELRERAMLLPERPLAATMIGEVEEVASNSSEFEIMGDDDKMYVVSCIEKDS